MNISSGILLVAVFGLFAGCGAQDSLIKSAMKAQWAENPDCSGRSLQLTGDAPEMKLHLYSNKVETDVLPINIFRETSNSTAVIGLNLIETDLLFDLSIRDDHLTLSKPYYSHPPSDAFFTMLEEYSGESRDKFTSNLDKRFDATGYYRCDT